MRILYKKFLPSFFLLICFTNMNLGQVKEGFLLLGKVLENEVMPLEGVTLTVMEGDQKKFEATTTIKGRFEINLELNKDYIIEFSKEGYVSIKISVSTDPKQKCKVKNWEAEIGRLSLIKRVGGVGYSMFDNIIAYYGWFDSCDWGRYDQVQILSKMQPNKNHNLKGKLLKQNKEYSLIPISNQKVNLKSDSITLLKSVITDQYGDFTFDSIEDSKKHILELAPNPELKGEKILLAKQNGIVVGSFAMNKQGFFHYELLPADIIKLEIIAMEPDVKMELSAFMKSAGREYTITENIYYQSGKWDITPIAMKRLDEVIMALIENPKIKVAILSHTDSRGDSSANLELSEKRTSSAINYLVSKKIDASRVSGKGFGESKILNRCTDGVICSELEHELNRRTEFKFIKE